MSRSLAIAILAGLLISCSSEERALGPDLPQTAPNGRTDPRISIAENNFYQISQGGRYFSWYGCNGCHHAGAPISLDAPTPEKRRSFTFIYSAIASGHPGLGFGVSIPSEQIWQLTAYVRDLPRHHEEKIDRLNDDQSSEPSGRIWKGPL